VRTTENTLAGKRERLLLSRAEESRPDSVDGGGELWNSIVDSVHKRIQAVIKEKRNQTKY